MRQKGIRFVPIYGRQAFKIDGNSNSGAVDFRDDRRCPGLVDMLTASGKKNGIEDPLPHARHRSDL